MKAHYIRFSALWIGLLIALLPMGSTAQNYYYVDVSNPSPGDGTATNPWNKIGTALFNVPYVSSTNQDAVVYIKRGTYTINPSDGATQLYIQTDRGGANGKYFVLKAYPGDEALVNVDGINLTTNPFNPFLAAIVNTSLVKLEGLTFSNLQNTNGYGVFIENASNVIINNCTFNNLRWNTDSAQSKYPTTNDFINPIHLSGGVTNTSITNNTFNKLAIGYGENIRNAGSNTGLTLTNNVVTNAISFASDYYVSLTGNDTTGNGSVTKPWRSVNKAVNTAGINYSTVPASLINVPINILVRGGTYRPTTGIFISELRGSNGQWFTLRNYPGETAIINAENLTTKFAAMIAVAGAKLTRIEGLHLTKLTNDSTLTTVVNGDSLKDTRFGIIVSGKAAGIVIKKNTLYDLRWTRNSAKQLFPQPNDNLGGITILGTTDTALRNVIIDSNVLYNITPGYTEAISVNGNVDSFSIINNLVHDIANIGIVAAGNYRWIENDLNFSVTRNFNYSKNGWIKGNEVYRCISPIAVSAGIYLDGSRNVTVEDNESYWNGTGCSVGNEQDSSTSGGHLVKSNVFRENLSAGLYYGSTNRSSIVDSCVVKWNTIKDNYYIDSFLRKKANNQYGAVNQGGKYPEVQVNRIKNSVFEENTVTSESQILLGFFYTQSNLTFRYNTYYNLPESACDAWFLQDKDNTGGIDIPDSVYKTFHQYVKQTGYDVTSTCEGVAYNPAGCGTTTIARLLPGGEIFNRTNSASVYPNPMKDQVTIQFKTTEGEIVSIRLVNSAGQTVYNSQKKYPRGIQIIGLNNRSFNMPAGIYHIQISSATMNETVKVVVN